MKSVMSHQFSQIPSVQIPRSKFNRSHGYKTTFNEGWLIPFYLDEALPGDTFNLKATLMARLATPIVPFMDNMFLETFYFAVPYRLIWANWQKFCGEQTNPGDSTDYLTPCFENSYWGQGSLGDYFGLPINKFMNGYICSSLPFRAYNLIYNQWFRDENLVPSAYINTGDSDSDDSQYTLRRRCKRHDYFTSCLPWPQKGDAVTLPLGLTAPVRGNGYALGLTDGTIAGQRIVPYSDNSTGGAAWAQAIGLDYHVGDTTSEAGGLTPNRAMGVQNSTFGPDTGLVADLETATAATINSLREAFQLQRMHERDARGGTRYTEIVRSHFGVISPDARLQRPEYLGGSSQRININAVQQTSSTDSTSPQGNLAAFGVVADGKGGFTKSFTEHCIVMGLLNVRADLTYQYGIPRMFSRQTRYDYYWPSLAHLGEQEVLNKEIFYQANPDVDTEVFGYQERFAEYRYFPSQITGLMRSDAPDSVDVWHLSQRFLALPTLNQSFIEENPPVSRVVAVETQPHFILDSYLDLQCARPMPVYSVPGLIDHF